MNGSKWIVAIYNPEMSPRYVERGLGLGKVELTANYNAAKRYETYEAAEKIAQAARELKKKERDGDHTAVEVIEEKPKIPEPSKNDEWVTQMQFAWGKDLAAGTLRLQMLKKDGVDWYRWTDDKGTVYPAAQTWTSYASAFLARSAEVTIGKLLDYEKKKAKK